MDQKSLGHPGDQGLAAAVAGKSAPSASDTRSFIDATPYPRSGIFGLDGAHEIDAAAPSDTTDPGPRVDKELLQIKNLADQGLWHGVHVALRWYTKSLVASGRPEAIAMIDDMNARVAEARASEPSRGWGDFPQGRILWTGPLMFPAAVLEAGGQATEVSHSVFH